MKEQGRPLLAELTPPMNPEESALEAARCLYCYDAPCVQACPTHIDIPLFIKQIASKNLVGSARTILEANALGHSCARVCPVEVLCEGSCVYLQWQKKPIEIARLQRRATDHIHHMGAQLFKPGPDNGLPVAVVGAGPAGLACAFYLRRLGHPVTIFERRPLAGGLNSHGIAEYKMTQAVALDEAQSILQLGAELKTGVEVGKDFPLERLEQEYKAIFIGIGLGPTRQLAIPGENLPGVFDALSFIEHIKNGRLKALPPVDTCVVIGAGNTAIDAVTQAKRTGTKRVLMAYRRSSAEMSAYSYEFELAKQDEIEFLWRAVPKRILGSSRVTGIKFKMAKGPDLVVHCQRVIKAIGQTAQDSLARQAGLELDGKGRIRVDPGSLRASNPRYWAGGDAINGGKEVVNAAADGKLAAWSIHKALAGATAPPPGQDYWVSTIRGRRAAASAQSSEAPRVPASV